MHRLPRAFTLRQQPTPFLHRALRQRNFSSVARRRRPNTLHQPSGEPVRYQSVRFQNPPYFTYRRALTAAIYFGVSYAYMSLIFRYLDVEIEILDDGETEEGEGQQQDGQTDREGREITAEEENSGVFYAEPDSTFIPMTWGTQLPREFYKGSDPEWQEFVKVAKDKPRHKKIQNELVQTVYTGAMQHPMVARQLGKEAKIGKYWLDISFPDGPPQDYERLGVEFGDGYIAWSKQKVSPETQWRLTRALWPQAAFDSVWATTKVLAGIQYRRAKQALGWEDKDPFSPEERYRHAIEMMAKQSQAREKKEVGNRQTPDGTSGAVVTAGSAASTLGKPSTSSADSDKKKLPWALDVPMPSLGEPTDLPIAMHVFTSTLTKQWNSKKRDPPRGTFVVQGLVEVRGQRGRIIFDVQSCYDPRAGKYVLVNAAVRSVKRWNQAPKGGP